MSLEACGCLRVPCAVAATTLVRKCFRSRTWTSHALPCASKIATILYQQRHLQRQQPAAGSAIGGSVGGWWRGGWWVVSVVVVVARCCDQLSLRSWADPCRVGLGLRPPPIMDRANILHRARLDQVFKRQCGQRTRPQWRLGVAGDAAVVAQHVRDARYIRAGCKANSADIRHLSGAG